MISSNISQINLTVGSKIESTGNENGAGVATGSGSGSGSGLDLSKYGSVRMKELQDAHMSGYQAELVVEWVIKYSNSKF